MAALCLQGPFILPDRSGADGSTETAAVSSAVGPAAANSQEAAAKFIDIRKKVWQGVFFFFWFFFCNLGTNVLLRSNCQELRAIRRFQRVTDNYENALVHFSLAGRKSVSFFHPYMWPNNNRAAPRRSHVVDGRQDEDEAKAKARRRRTNDFEFLDVQTALVRSLQMFFFFIAKI